MQKEMDKKIRVMRAQKNIEYFNKKKLIALKNSKISLSPKKSEQ